MKKYSKKYYNQIVYGILKDKMEILNMEYNSENFDRLPYNIKLEVAEKIDAIGLFLEREKFIK